MVQIKFSEFEISKLMNLFSFVLVAVLNTSFDFDVTIQLTQEVKINNSQYLLLIFLLIFYPVNISDPKTSVSSIP